LRRQGIRGEIYFFLAELKLKIRSGALTCPACGGGLAIHSYYPRTVIGSDGLAIEITVMRAICRNSGCGKTHSILSDSIMPYKRYSADVIEAAILYYEKNGSLIGCLAPAENSTIYRWVRYFKLKGEWAADRLHAILFSSIGDAVSVISLREKTIFERIACLLQAFFPEAPERLRHSGVIGTANILLTSYGSGFI
jgi:hypothetical protein